MADRIGSLSAGKLADITIVDTLASHLRPIHDPFATLVYSARAGDVETVLVGGNIVVQDKQVLTMDEAEIIHKAQLRADELRRSAGLN